jgi:hypothetical protein
MAKVLNKQHELLITPSLDLNRSVGVAPAKTVRVEKLHLSELWLCGFVKRAYQCGNGSEGAMHAALLNVLKAFGKALFNEGFGRKNQMVVLQLNFQVIARS